MLCAQILDLIRAQDRSVVTVSQILEVLPDGYKPGNLGGLIQHLRDGPEALRPLLNHTDRGKHDGSVCLEDCLRERPNYRICGGPRPRGYYLCHCGEET